VSVSEYVGIWKETVVTYVKAVPGRTIRHRRGYRLQTELEISQSSVATARPGMNKGGE
jgi:hypothetical protein